MTRLIRPMTAEEVANWPYLVQCCRTCAHSNDEEASSVHKTYCTRPGGFYNGRPMEKTSRCASWTAPDAA